MEAEEADQGGIHFWQQNSDGSDTAISGPFRVVRVWARAPLADMFGLSQIPITHARHELFWLHWTDRLP